MRVAEARKGLRKRRFELAGSSASPGKALWVRFNPSVSSGVMQLGEKMGLLFRDWLTDQRDRQDGIGDLARNFALEDVTKKLSGRKSDEHKSWADAVIKSDIPGHIYAFNDAWQEFLQADRN